MRSLLLMSILALLGVASQRVAFAQPGETADHSLAAFGGHLLGTDRGEWVGKLTFQDANGNLVALINENVHGIVKNSEGIFVFTGLAHMSLNEGEIFAVTRTPDGKLTASSVGYLPGAPSRVRQREPGGATSFLVYSGFRGDQRLFNCYQLIGKVVSRGQDCLPPE